MTLEQGVPVQMQGGQRTSSSVARLNFLLHSNSVVRLVANRTET
jgi:hypothetical protein